VGTALPLPATPITASNASQVTALARWGWGEPVVAWSPDGARLALSSDTGLTIVDATTLIELVQVSAREALLSQGQGIAWSPDGQWLLTTGAFGNNPVHLWRWDGTNLTRKTTFNLKDESFKGALTFSSDSTIVAFNSMKDVFYLYRVPDGTSLGIVEPPKGEARCVAFSPDSKLLATYGPPDGETPQAVRLWTLADRKPVRKCPVGDLSLDLLGFTPDGALLLASKNYTSEVLGWEVTTGRQLAAKELAALRLPANRVITDNLATDADGRLMVLRTNHGVRILRPNSEKVALPLKVNLEQPSSVFSPDVSAFAHSSGGVLTVVRLPAGTVTVSRQGAVGQVSRIAVAPDGATVACGGGENATQEAWVRFWRLADGTMSGELPKLGDWVHGLAYIAKGTRIGVGQREGGVSVRELPSGKEVANLPAEEELTCLAVSPDGQRAALGLENGEVCVWDLATATLRVTIPAHKKPVGAVGFLADGATIFSAGTDLWGRLWSSEDGEPVGKLKHGRAVITGAASPDGRLIATSCADKRIYLWNATDGKEVRAIAAGRSGVQQLAWSPAGDLLVAASRSLIQLWNPATGDLLTTLKGHFWDVESLAFSPDGSCLFSGSGEGTLQLWGLT
jgi:WD40 repeat protein